MNTFTYGSLFSGIGGIDLGLDRVGMQCKWQCEIDEYATKVLTKHWPDVTRFRDIRTVGKHNLAPVDLICGGFPCQPHSVAGKRKASKDERDLWKEFYRIICELRPAWVLAENVPDLLSSESGRFYGRVLRDLAQSGYDAEWQVLSAAQFGAPHLRRRLFIVAYPGSTGAGMEAYRSGRQERQYPVSSQSTLLRQENWAFGTEGADASCQDVPHSKSQQGRGIQFSEISSNIRTGSEVFRGAVNRSSFWEIEPAICRVVDGPSSQVDRLRGLGNAVVPQIAEYIGNCIMNYHQQNLSPVESDG